MLDTPIKVATCNRCGRYVFLADVSGLRTAVDPQPLDVEGVRACLLAGRGLYDQLDQGGRPWKLHARTALSSWPPFGGRKVLAEHGCGAKGRDATAVTILDPPSSGATSGVKPIAASDGAYRRSDVPYRCNACKCLIEESEPYVAIEHGTYRWARHERDCTPKGARRV